MYKKLITAFVTIASLFVFAAVLSPANAGKNCDSYGRNCPRESYLVIDKYIRDPRVSGDVYVDNLTYNDYRFAPGEDVVFKVVVKNVGDKTIHNVRISDTIPDVTYFLMLSGDTNPDMREITKDWGSVAPNEIREWYFRVRVKPASQIGDTVVCGSPYAINRAVVRGDDVSDSYDSASFCVEKTVLGVTTHPSTGAELVLIGSALATLTGIGIVGRKFIK